MILSFCLRFFRWLMRKVNPLVLIFFLLYLLAMVCLCLGLSNIVLYLQTDWILASTFFCILVGWSVASSRLSAWKAGVLSLGLGLTWLLLVVGRMYTLAGAVISAYYHLDSQAVMVLIEALGQHRFVFPAMDLRPLAESWNGLGAGLTALSDRLANWITATRTGTSLIDPLVTNLLWNAAVCLLSFWGAWFIRRRGAVLDGLLPSVALLTYLLYYTNSKSGVAWLIPLGGILVLLQAAEGYRSAWERWHASHMDRVELEAGLAAVVLGLAAGLMVVGAILPSVSIPEIRRDIQRYIQDRQSERLAKSLGLQQSPGNGGSLSGSVLLPPVHRINAGTQLPQDVVMYVTIAGYHPLPLGAPIEGRGQEISPTYYFRGQTYDDYTGFGWTAYPASDSDYSAGTSLLSQSAEAVTLNSRSIRQYVQRTGDQGGTLFVSGELVSVDQAFQVTWRGQDDLITAQTDALAYWAESRQTVAPVNRLRSAGAIYPASIRARYLQLPEGLPDRVRNLALDLTAAQTTPYDQAEAIEAYLRQFPYTLDVPAPPLGRDAADFFLFDLRKGYCDYFATAMTVLARAAGIPARTVTGYVSNLFDYDRGQFVVTAADSHTWVDIYIPGVGWVEFEPTPNLPSITNPGEVETNLGLLPNTPAKPGIENAIAVFLSLWFHRLTLYLLVGSLALVVVLLLPIGRWILLIQPTDRAVAAIQRSLYRGGRRWGVRANAAHTPSEYAAEFLDRLSGRLEGRQAAALESIEGDLGQLTLLYNRVFYSSQRLSSRDHRQAVQTWYHLRRRLIWLWLRELITFRRRRHPNME